MFKQRGVLGKEGNRKTWFNHFLGMWELNKDFFFEINMDEDNHIRNVL